MASPTSSTVSKIDMTAQISEILRYQGRELSMCTCPLNGYLVNTAQKIRFDDFCSALWRGYVGTWEIIESRLYLLGLSGSYDGGKELSLASLFPDYPDGVFAHWFTGQIRCPRGKLINYVHMGYASVYEEDLILEFKAGVLVGESIIEHGKARDGAPEGYSIGGYANYPIKGKS